MATKLNLTALTVGPTAAAVRRSVSPQQWRTIVNAAHKQGYAVNSFLDPNTPGPLKERTPAYLKNQAVQNVATAYAPAYKELDQRASQVKALDTKRAADNQYYLNWLTTQKQALDTAAQSSDAALTSAAQTIQQSTGAAYDQAEQASKQQLSQLPGTVSDFSHANAFAGTEAAKATGVGQVGATAGQALQAVGTGQAARSLADANNFATIAALEAKRVGDTWGALQGVADDKLKATLAQGQDAAKAISDALQNEVTKAQSNRDYAAVTQKLGLQQQDVTSQMAARRSAARLGKERVNVTEQNLQETKRYHNQLVSAKQDANSFKEADFAAKWGVSRATFLSWSDQQRQDYLARARQRGVITGGKKGANAFTPTAVRKSEQDYRSALNWARGHKPSPGELNNLVAALQAPKSGKTVHDPTTGKIVYNPDGTAKTEGGGLGLSDPLLAEAVATVAIYGGVDAKLRAKIQDAYGITLPLSKVSFNSKGKKLYDTVK